MTRWLTGRMPPTPADELRDLADVVADLGAGTGSGVGADAGAWDRYGDHGPVAALEARLADLLGKPAVAVFPSGIMAQQSMLRVGGDTRGSRLRRLSLLALALFAAPSIGADAPERRLHRLHWLTGCWATSSRPPTSGSELRPRGS